MSRTGRPITAPGPIGDLARTLGPGGMAKLAQTLGLSYTGLLKAAQEGRMPDGSAGHRLYILCQQQGIEVPEPTRTGPAWD